MRRQNGRFSLNWISLLYPRPHFEVSPALGWLRYPHTVALHVAYYLTHTLALMGLIIIYVLVVLPLRVFQLIKSEDPMELKLGTSKESYFVTVRNIEDTDFNKMY